MDLLKILLFLSALLGLSYAVTIKVGAMYGESTHINDVYKNILTDAAQHINRDGTILPQGDEIAAVHFNSPTEEGWARHSVSVGVRAACSFINNKDAHALILPDDICLDCQGVGYIMGNAYSPTLTTDQSAGSGSIKMYPITDEMIELVSKVIKHYRWSTFIIMYDGDSGYDMVNALMGMSPETGWTATPIALDGDDPNAQMKDIKARAVKNIVVYMHIEENLKKVVDAAYEEGLLFDTWHWLFGNPNVAYLGKTFLETKLRYNSAFLTRFKMETASSVGGSYFTRRADAIRKWPFRQQTTYDSLLAVGHALKQYKEQHNNYPPSGRCGITKSQLLSSFSKFSFEGCSGEVAFNEHGDRVNYTIKIFVGKNQYLSINTLGVFTQNIHHWEQKNNQKWPGEPGSNLYMKPYRMAEESHIHILTIEEPPFIMRYDYEQIRNPRRNRRATGETIDNGLYIGYVPALLEAIKHVFEDDMGLDFSYRLELLGEGNYGRFDKSTKEWDGMMRDLFDGDADIIAAALTKTNIREDYIDFTGTWYKSDVQLLVKHPTYIWEYPFVPLFPFNIYSWLTNFLAFVVASILMWVVSYLNQNELRAKASRGEVPKEDGETFSFINTFYYMLSIMAFQGFPSKSPHSYTGRVLSGFWFAYTLMMVWLYVSSLTPLMKASKVPYKIRSLFDLNKQESFDFGVVRKSPTFDLFHQATKGDKRITWDDIQTGDEQKIVQDLIDGVRKVRRDNGGYALLSEKKMLEYEALRWPCDMLIVGGYVTKIKFPLAVQSGSPLRDQLTYAIKKIKGNGVLANITSQSFYTPYCEKIYKKQWHKQAKKKITSQDLAGVYYLMMLGGAATLIIFTIETIFFYLRGGTGFVNKIPPLRRFSRSGSEGMAATSRPLREKAVHRDDYDDRPMPRPAVGGGGGYGRGGGQANGGQANGGRDWI
ncbi:glutamate receptor 1 [Strongylocentrotus purpuratus]|uniref:Ionotropic glutamate receptor C-terminal domain-containing protein n=1 Tax=Strongylocentrotus purpuratus TaxID=7668 RepID=A0A7M7GJJ8_STRPU|nr:glutamate receptor 1 [Strongylocentrotus purpuratus]|eukprot:XP_003727830.1 PREDICTED: glutamate receptor 1 [Strongylocentrotus purpuratus]